eukprot:Skav221873  [mRNA]  locus=scaffold1395:216102:220461:+ [translate_table: standard]
MWIGGRKGRIGLQGGSPGNVRAHSGDLPIAPESGGAGPGRRNLYAWEPRGNVGQWVVKCATSGKTMEVIVKEISVDKGSGLTWLDDTRLLDVL